MYSSPTDQAKSITIVTTAVVRGNLTQKVELVVEVFWGVRLGSKESREHGRT